MRSCIRPLVAAVDTAAGRYGDARTRGRSTKRAHGLLHKDCFIWSGSFRSFSLTVHRPPHTLKSPDAMRGALRSCHRCRGGSVVLLLRYHCPKTTSHFIRQCNGDAHTGFARQHICQPTVMRRSKTLNRLKNGHSRPGSACLHAGEGHQRPAACECRAGPFSRFYQAEACRLSSSVWGPIRARLQNPDLGESSSDQVQRFLLPRL